jgi:hypothetical protein
MNKLWGLALGSAVFLCAAAGSASAWGYKDEPQDERPCYVKARPKIVHRTFRRRILIQQGSYESEYTQPLYGEVVSSSVFGRGDRQLEGAVADDHGSGERVLLKPYRNIAIYHPARYRWITERLAIQPEGYVWRKVSRRCR